MIYFLHPLHTAIMVNYPKITQCKKYKLDTYHIIFLLMPKATTQLYSSSNLASGIHVSFYLTLTVSKVIRF